MKWIIKLLLIFLLAIGLVFLLKFNQTTIVIFTTNKRIDISLSAIIILLFLTFIIIFYGINYATILHKKFINKNIKKNNDNQI